MRSFILIVLAFFSFSTLAVAQNVGIGTNVPKTFAKLDIVSSSSGLSIPTLDNGARATLGGGISALGATGSANYNGLMIYDSDDNALYIWDPTKTDFANGGWTMVLDQDNAVSGTIVGDVKHGFQPTDHSGWVVLDGRAISSLTVTQQANAVSLGFSGNIPNATNRVLKDVGALGSTGGGYLVSLAQSNLPNVTFTGTTNSSGNHNHDFYTANNDVNSAASQGYPAGNNHVAFRTTDRRQRIDDNNTIISAGNHNHSVTVSSGGSNVPIDIIDAYLSTNTFIYLGN